MTIVLSILHLLHHLLQWIDDMNHILIEIAYIDIGTTTALITDDYFPPRSTSNFIIKLQTVIRKCFSSWLGFLLKIQHKTKHQVFTSSTQNNSLV